VTLQGLSWAQDCVEKESKIIFHEQFQKYWRIPSRIYLIHLEKLYRRMKVCDFYNFLQILFQKKTWSKINQKSSILLKLKKLVWFFVKLIKKKLVWLLKKIISDICNLNFRIKMKLILSKNVFFKSSHKVVWCLRNWKHFHLKIFIISTQMKLWYTYIKICK